jgi:cell division protein FtsB
VASLEARVQAQFSELARLRRENDLKDHTIEALRSDLIDQRSKQALRKSHATSTVHFGSMGMAEF